MPAQDSRVGEPTVRSSTIGGDGGGSSRGENAAPIPERVGRFVIRGKLGEGGMGVVLLGHDAVLDRDVAVKVLHADREDGQAGQARMLREARAMARLSHPNVITVYDVDAFEDRVFIAMEYVQGTTLRIWLEQHRPWRRVLEAFVQAGRGLEAAHGAGLVHRDFKPDNVLVGTDGRLRVLDFGLARAAGQAEERGGAAPTKPVGDGRLTVSGVVVGTPAYMAPEQFAGEPADHRTDQFAFCIALWEALFAKRPFSGESYAEIATRVTQGQLDDPPETGPVPRWLIEVLRRGLRGEPAQRYPGMGELLAVLSQLSRHGTHAPAVDAAPIDSGGRVATGSEGVVARRYVLLAPPTGTTGRRAHDRLTGRMVMLHFADEPAGLGGSADHELVDRVQRLAHLRHPHVAGILDFGLHESRRFWVTDLLEGGVDFVQAMRAQPPAIQLSLLVQALQGLAYLHRRRILHLALDPADLRVDHGTVTIVGLGETVRTRPLSSRARSATHAAPEVLLGVSADETADLYALASITCEALLGRPPYGTGAHDRLLEAKLAADPVVAGAEIEPALAAVLERTLARDPSRRPRSAEEILEALARGSGVPMVLETVETREGFLAAARFVGRAFELDALDQALKAALEGKGAVWLIGGESGIGKSRLVEELRMRALARGIPALRGRATTEGELAYEVWRDVLRFVVLVEELDDFAAGVLATRIADLPQLIGRRPPEPAALDASGTEARFRTVVEALFRRIASPILVTIDDLQWARSESVELLDLLARIAAELPIVVVAAYRDDEAPELPARVPAARRLVLPRLDRAAIEELGAAMIGRTGSSAAVLDLLARESEGNAFFLVEVVRTLAEEAGGLAHIGAPGLPERVLSGGVRKVVRRRIERIPAADRELLEAAAIVGRSVDAPLLAALFPDRDVPSWSRSCVEAAIFDRDENGGLRFSHDKLREYVTQALPEDRARALHLAVARALEASGRAPDLVAHALALHYGRAGALAEEAHHCAVAGEVASRSGAHLEACELIERALALRPHASSTRLEQVRLHRLLGDARYVMGDLGRAVEALGGALTAAGRALPRGRIGLSWSILRSVVVQVLLRWFPGRFEIRSPTRRALLQETGKAAGRLANLSTYRGDELHIGACSLISANLCERAGVRQPYSLAVMGYASAYAGMHGIASRYFTDAREEARAQGDVQGFVEAVQMECSFLLGLAEFDRCRDLLEEARMAAQRAGFGLGEALAWGFIAQCDYLQGKFDAMLAHASFAIELLRQPAPAHRHSLLCCQALALVHLGRLDEARALLEESGDPSSAQYLLAGAFALANWTFVHAFAGDHEKALATAEQTLAYVDEHAIAIPPPCLQVYAAPAAACLERSSPALLGKLATTMERWSRNYPVGLAPALLVRAHALTAAGRHRAAVDRLRQAVAEADRRGLGFFAACAEASLGAALAVLGDERSRQHLLAAHERFRRCGAGLHAHRVRVQLGWTPGTDPVALEETSPM